MIKKEKYSTRNEYLRKHVVLFDDSYVTQRKSINANHFKNKTLNFNFIQLFQVKNYREFSF